LRSRKDWSIVRCAIADGYVLVTNDTTDFRALMRRKQLRAGLVCINRGVDRLFGRLRGDAQADR
jgi:predicted nuclease of predicted toxin-antitoxin system